MKPNLRRAFLPEDEFMGLLRQQGTARIDEVKQCYMEWSGTRSIIPVA